MKTEELAEFLLIRMKVTVELLERYNACAQGINFIKEKYPDGAEILEIAKDPNLPIEFAHFARKYFPLSEEEVEVYNQICRVVNSKKVLNSTGVYNSSYVFNSKEVVDSSNISDSSNIEDGTNINNSEWVRCSQEVWSSKFVNWSHKIIHSTNITNSWQVAHSSHVDWGHNILYSIGIKDSSFIYKSHDLTHCDFCGFMVGSSDCMFCCGLEGARHQIFNKEVSEEEYRRAYEELLFQLEVEISKFIIINESRSILKPTERFVYENRFDSIFNGLSDEFYGWISTLPNYNDEVFLNLFFRDQNLKNQ